MSAALVVIIVVGVGAMGLSGIVSSMAAVGRIPRNRFVGIRFPATLASDAAWRAGHRAAVRPAWVSCGIVLIVDVAVLAIGVRVENDQVVVLVLAGLLVLAIAWMSVAAGRAARAAGPGWER